VRVDSQGDVWYSDLTGWLGKLDRTAARRIDLDLRKLFAWPPA
jgi:hypothetical protein